MSAWRHIQSSAISAAAWQKSSLYIRFISGNEYEYYNVPKEIYERLTHATSAGKFFNTMIKERYKYRRVV